jgi:hypothetical protein
MFYIFGKKKHGRSINFTKYTEICKEMWQNNTNFPKMERKCKDGGNSKKDSV